MEPLSIVRDGYHAFDDTKCRRAVDTSTAYREQHELKDAVYTQLCKGKAISGGRRRHLPAPRD